MDGLEGNGQVWGEGGFYHDLTPEQRYELELANLKLGLKKAPKLNQAERALLEFCHDRDMHEFLKEEFERHPIKLNGDGELIGENPFDRERTERKTFFDPIFGYMSSPNKDENPYLQGIGW